MAQRFCGTGRKWCGKICISSNHVCRKGMAANKIEKRTALKKKMVRKRGFKNLR